jgi:hypothetical protein
MYHDSPIKRFLVVSQFGWHALRYSEGRG